MHEIPCLLNIWLQSKLGECLTISVVQLSMPLATAAGKVHCNAETKHICIFLFRHPRTQCVSILFIHASIHQKYQPVLSLFTSIFLSSSSCCTRIRKQSSILHTSIPNFFINQNFPCPSLLARHVVYTQLALWTWAIPGLFCPAPVR